MKSENTSVHLVLRQLVPPSWFILYERTNFPVRTREKVRSRRRAVVMQGSRTRNPTVLVKNMCPNTPLETKLSLENLLVRGFDRGHVAWKKIVCPVDYSAYNVSTHGYVYYKDAEDASRVQQYLHGMKVAGTLISAILILPDDTMLTTPIKEKEETLLSFDMFPELPQSDKSENFDIYDILEEDTSWLTEDMVNTPD